MKEKSFLSVDDDYMAMQSVLLAEGRGRRKTLAKHPLTNRLLLQVYALREECGKTWDEMVAFIFTVARDITCTEKDLQTEVFSTLRKARKIKVQERPLFLGIQLSEVLEKNVGRFLQQRGLARSRLLKPQSITANQRSGPVTNGMVTDCLHFRRVEGLTLAATKDLLNHLGLSTNHLSYTQLNQTFKKTQARYSNLSAKIKKPHGQEKFEDWLSSAFSLPRMPSAGLPSPPPVYTPMPISIPAKSESTMSSPVPAVSSTPVPATSLAPVPAVPSAPVPAVPSALVVYQRKNAAQRRQLEDQGRQIESLTAEKQTLLDVVAECRQKEKALLAQCEQEHQKVTALSTKAATLQTNNDSLKEALVQARRTISTIKASNFHRRLKRQEKQLQQNQAAAEAHAGGGCKQLKWQLKKKLKLAQTQLSDLHKKVLKLKEKGEVTAQLEAEIQRLLTAGNAPPVINTRVAGTNKFTDEIVKCTIGLMALGVSGNNCGPVMQTVASQLFCVDIPSSALPSERSAIRFADQGHCLAKIQIADAILQSTSYDIHTDGTSRDHRKYVGQQITTSAGPLCCGFTEVATEDSNTRVDITIRLLQEVTELYHQDEKDANFKEALHQLSGMMSDRAVVMKLQKKEFNSFRKATLGTDEDLQFLYCNAHFLLGLSSCVEKVFKELQAEWGLQKIGRDAAPRFATFSVTEPAAVRCIRMACEVLARRGDEKNGCRELWGAVLYAS